MCRAYVDCYFYVQYSRLLNFVPSDMSNQLQRNILLPVSQLCRRTFSISFSCLTNTTAIFQCNPFKLHKLSTPPSDKVTCTREEALQYLRQMFLVRRLENMANSFYKEKLIRGFCHLYSGQEAVCVGMEASLRQSDVVISGYRIHGWTHIRGASIVNVLAELIGVRSGCSRGKGGSMHMYWDNFYGGNGIVGAQMPLGAGIALGQKYLANDNITVALCGDGAFNQGQVFEAFNMAKLWSLPILFVVENNGYGMGTSTERSSASIEYYKRGDYIPGLWVDGMDVLAVREATSLLANKCRQGEGPFVMEMATYRYHGHSVSDPGTSYRTRDEVQEIRKTRDPINLFQDKLIQTQLITEEEIKDIDNMAKKEVDEAGDQVRNDLPLEEKELYKDIYVEYLEDYVRGVGPFDEHHLGQLSKNKSASN